MKQSGSDTDTAIAGSTTATNDRLGAGSAVPGRGQGGLGPAGAGAAGGAAKGARIVGDTTSDNGGPGPRLMTADTLIGNAVMNHQGDTLGEIEDIMLDVPGGHIAYAVMSAGGFLGMGEKLFAIPWKALSLDTERKCFLLDADKERIQNAPGFDKDHWPDQAQMEWQQGVHDYYKATPYWDF